MPTAAARFLSYVLHPLLMPFYAAVLLMNLNTYIAFSISGHVQRIIISLVFITTGVMPLLTAVLLLQKGIIKSLDMESVSERRIPFITTAVYYLVCFYLLNQLPVPRMLSLMVLGATITIFSAWLISFVWKISIHMIGIGGLTGLLFAITGILHVNLTAIIITCVIIAGLLGTSRIIMGAHSPSQIYAGFVIGLVVEYITVMMAAS